MVYIFYQLFKRFSFVFIFFFIRIHYITKLSLGIEFVYRQNGLVNLLTNEIACVSFWANHSNNYLTMFQTFAEGNGHKMANF